jgi:transcriptional regulator with XRE-family HTH domain
MTTKPGNTDYSAMVMRHVRRMRKRRGWSAEHLAELVTATGEPIHRSTLAGMEIGKTKHVSVDQLVAFATVFGVPIETFLQRLCESCDGQPPTGFRCLACGAEADSR